MRYITLQNNYVSASTLPNDGHMMTVQESAALFGQSFDVTYLDSSGVLRSSSAVYSGSTYITEMNGYVDDAGYLNTGREFLFYRMYDASYALNTQPQNVTVRLNPQYSIFDTEYIYTAIAVMSANSDQSTSLAAYDSPVWRWVWNGNIVNFDSVSIANNDVLPHLNFDGKGSQSFDFVRAYMSSQATTSGSSIEATFDHVQSWSVGADVFIMVGCPYISSSAYGGSGTLDTSGSVTTTTQINVNVDVDLDETNGLLGSIYQGISNFVSGILTGIQNFFIPSHDDITNFKNSLESSLTQHFGPLFTSRQLITSAFQNLDDLTVSNSFVVPQIDVPVRVSSNGTVLDTQSFFGNTVELRPQYAKLHVLYDSLEILINMIMTLWTVNTLRNMVNNYILNWHDYQDYDPEGVIDS